MDYRRVKCPRCHSLNPAGRKRCHMCGTYLPASAVGRPGDTNGTSIWTTGMKSFAYIIFFAVVFLGLFFMNGAYEVSKSAFTALVVFAAFVAAAFLLVAVLMIYIQIAEDISETKKVTKRIASVLYAERSFEAGSDEGGEEEYESENEDEDEDESGEAEIVCGSCGCKFDSPTQKYCTNCGSSVKKYIY